MCRVPAAGPGFGHSSGAVVLCSTLLAGILWTPLLLSHKLLLTVPQFLAYWSSVHPYQELEGTCVAPELPGKTPSERGQGDKKNITVTSQL